MVCSSLFVFNFFLSLYFQCVKQSQVCNRQPLQAARIVLSGVAAIVLLRMKEMKFHNYISTCSPQPQATQGQSVDSISTNTLNPATSGHLGISGMENAL